MSNVEVAFSNQDARRALWDYTQFQTAVLTSARSGGKTYLCDDYILNKFFKHGKYFAYVRESQIEIDNALGGGLWDLNLLEKKYANHTFTTKGNKIYIDDCLVGVGIAITTYCNIRGVVYNFGEKIQRERKKELIEQVEEYENFVKNTFKDLDTIFFDEFEPLSPKMSSDDRYQGFLHTADTLFRFRKNVRTIMCANLEKSFSPFLMNFNFGDLKKLDYGIKKSYTEKSRKGKIQPLAVWAHIKPNEEWKDLRDDSYVGKLIRGKDSGMFTTGQSYKGMNFKKIEGKPLHRIILWNITDGTNSLTFWKTRTELFYITARTTNACFPTYTFNLKQCGEGVNIIPKSFKNMMLQAFERGKVEFDTAQSFEIFRDMIPSTLQIRSRKHG